MKDLFNVLANDVTMIDNDNDAHNDNKMSLKEAANEGLPPLTVFTGFPLPEDQQDDPNDNEPPTRYCYGTSFEGTPLPSEESLQDEAEAWLASHGGRQAVSPPATLDTSHRYGGVTIHGRNKMQPPPQVTGDMQSFETPCTGISKVRFLKGLKALLSQAKDGGHLHRTRYERGAVGGLLGTSNPHVGIWDASLILEEVAQRGLLKQPDLEGLLQRHEWGE